MAKLKLYLDDVRPLPPQYEVDGGWTVVRDPDALVVLIAQHGLGNIDTISFDHDLGEPPMKTGYDVLRLIEQAVYLDTSITEVPEFRIHSANPVGRKNMVAAIKSIHRIIAGRDM